MNRDFFLFINSMKALPVLDYSHLASRHHLKKYLLLCSATKIPVHDKQLYFLNKSFYLTAFHSLKIVTFFDDEATGFFKNF